MSAHKYNRLKDALTQRKYLNSLKIKLVLYYNSQCKICGTESNLQFAHIKSTKLSGHNERGQKAVLLDVQKHKDCYTLLCYPHHKLYDAGEISLEGVPF